MLVLRRKGEWHPLQTLDRWRVEMERQVERRLQLLRRQEQERLRLRFRLLKSKQ